MIGSIRDAKPGDSDAIAGILHGCRQEIGLKDHVTRDALKQFAASVGPNKFPTWVIEEGNTVIAVMVTNPIEDGGLDIFYLAVHPTRQGLSLGPRLIDLVQSQGWPRITAKATPGNQRVAAVFQRKGFQLVQQDEANKDWVHFEWRPASGTE